MVNLFNPAMVMAVAGGGALGSLLRYWVGNIVAHKYGSAFPWGTLLINVVGSFVIGLLAESFALRWDATPALRAFLAVGICGGFTTFSTFALDATVLMGRGEMGAAAFYMVGSILLSILALYGAMFLVRSVF